MSQAKPLNGPNILLEGPSGTGKTFALGTLVDWAQSHDMKVNVLFTENGAETLLGYWKDAGVPPFNRKEPLPLPTCLSIHQQTTRPISLESLIKGQDLTGKSTYEMLTKLTDNTRDANNPSLAILQSCADFKDDLTGESRGNMGLWGTDTIFVIDSLSELANAYMKTVIGYKPTASPSDYGVAQNGLMNFIRLLTQGYPFTFVLTGHVDRDTDEITGVTKIMTKAIGKALRSDIPPLFSDVIYTVREGGEFFWDTAAFGVDVKTRSLGYRSKIRPDFAQIMDMWLLRGTHLQGLNQ